MLCIHSIHRITIRDKISVLGGNTVEYYSLIANECIRAYMRTRARIYSVLKNYQK
jgi:hypothetical protein